MCEIQESELFEKKEVYRDQIGKTFVYFAKWRKPTGEEQEVAVKEVQIYSILESYTYIEECINQLRIDSSHVCKIFGWNVQPQKVSIVMERLDKDLAREIAERRAQDNSFTEEELTDLLHQVTSVFVRLQRMSISHNDIKAENIFLQRRDGSVTYKVGDFGSASMSRCFESTLNGTPLYLSPILKREHILFNQTRKRREIPHNTFKSDVFSLGITLLFAMELTAPNDLLELNCLETKLEAHLQHIAPYYKSLEGLMRMMLKVDETQRYDFMALSQKASALVTISSEQRSLPMFSLPRQTPDFGTELNKLYSNSQWESLRTLLEVSNESCCRIVVTVEEPPAAQSPVFCIHCMFPLSGRRCSVCNQVS